VTGPKEQQGASAPRRDSWLRRYRMLVIAYGVASMIGAREYLIGGDGGPTGAAGCEASAASCFAVQPKSVPPSDSAFWSRNARMLDVLEVVNPGEPDTEFLEGAQALSEGDEAAFIRHFERALASGAKHNHMLLQYYAQSLLDREADWRVVNRAVTTWRENHPFSKERLRLQLAAGPRTESDQRALMEALHGVVWIEDAALDRYIQGGVEQWTLQMAFLPGRSIDVREAVAAVTLLSLPEDQRRHYVVTCQTLKDCTAERRSGR
jgi:hypothetical protein